MKYKIDYYGYVYKWINNKNGKMYIGSHYGSVDDYYTGSGIAFKSAYQKDPSRFSIVVLEYLIENDKKLLLQKEQKWLDTVPNIRENKEYYNLNNYSVGGSSHITKEHIKKRSKTLKEKHKLYGLSKAELSSYEDKIKTRLLRISDIGFTKKEQDQHNKYGFLIEVILPDGTLKIFNSCNQAKKELGIDILYGLKVCAKKSNFKGYVIKKLRDPIIDCRQKNRKNDV